MGALARWPVRLDRRDGPERWVGVPSMSALARHLGRGIAVHSGTRVVAVEGDGGRWRLRCDDGSARGPFDIVVVAVPAPQAGPLLAEAPALAARAGEALLAPCWALMLAFAAPLPTERRRGLRRGGDALLDLPRRRQARPRRHCRRAARDLGRPRLGFVVARASGGERRRRRPGAARRLRRSARARPAAAGSSRRPPLALRQGRAGAGRALPLRPGPRHRRLRRLVPGPAARGGLPLGRGHGRAGARRLRRAGRLGPKEETPCRTQRSG